MPTYDEYRSNPAIAYNMINSAASSSMPTGAIIMYGSASAPSGWLLCNGQATTGYDDLAAIVGATVPDLRNRFIVGAGSTYSSGTTGGATTQTLAVGNLPSHTHTTPAHNHTITSSGSHSHAQNVIADTGGGSGVRSDYDADVTNGGAFPQGTTTGTDGAHTHNTSSDGSGTSGGTGSGTAFSVLPPYYALTYIIKT